ncbi:MAG: PEP-CTERM sorting domain-containing protein [Thermodesulfobacteriota bacterium]|nr:PEP-CTERM sorting domain-containing protein [Thermodesulfobacteriota bacterium]
MKRLALLLVLVAAVMLMLPGSGYCQIMVDDDYLSPDVIGKAIYDIYAWDITVAGQTVDIQIFTDYPGADTIAPTGVTNTWDTFAGDLMISAGSGYEYGVAFTGHDGFTQGNLYHVTDWKTSDEHNPLYGVPGPEAFEYRHGMDVTIAATDNSFGGAVTDFAFAVANTVYGSGDYLYHVALDLALVPGLSVEDIDSFYWASGTCGNDIIQDSPLLTAVPEPATVLLVGFGLVGLAGLGRRKFLKG